MSYPAATLAECILPRSHCSYLVIFLWVNSFGSWSISLHSSIGKIWWETQRHFCWLILKNDRGKPTLSHFKNSKWVKKTHSSLWDFRFHPVFSVFFCSSEQVIVGSIFCPMKKTAKAYGQGQQQKQEQNLVSNREIKKNDPRFNTCRLDFARGFAKKSSRSTLFKSNFLWLNIFVIIFTSKGHVLNS